jgi:hypothetical protein
MTNVASVLGFVQEPEGSFLEDNNLHGENNECQTCGPGAVPTEYRRRTSLIWNVRFEPIYVAPPLLAGRVVARDGV